MHVSTCLVSSCPSFSFLCLLFPSLFSSLLSSLTGRFARVPVYVRLPVRVRRVHRDRGEGSASYVPLYVAGLSSRFSKKIHDVTTMIADESNISRTSEPPLLLGPSRISSTSSSALRFLCQSNRCNVWCLRIDHLSQARPYLPAITRPRREEFVGIFFVPFAHEETFRRLLSNLLAMEHENSWGRSSSAPGVGTLRASTIRVFSRFLGKFRNRINRCAFISNTVAYYLRYSPATNSFSNVGSNNSFRGAIAAWPSDTLTRMRCFCRRKIATRNVYRLLVAIRVSYLLIGGT